MKISPRIIERRGGFALLLSVTLLGFLALLLVGLAGYARLETVAVGDAVYQQQAREMALVAQDLAVARLQRLAGPDQRVTATSDSIANAPSLRWTGVWDATNTDPAPLGWLVSGNGVEGQSGSTEIVGLNSSGAARSVVAPLEDFRTSDGSAASRLLGRFAWWVGDEGVKSPVGLPDRIDSLTAAPYASIEARLRLRQQLPVAGLACAATGETLVDVMATPNASLLAQNDLLAFSQLAFLRDTGGGQLGLGRLREHFYDWSIDNAAVLADTRDGGLRQDLSAYPQALGAAFSAWTDYRSYTEDPAAPVAGTTPIAPAYGAEPLRRRHRIMPPVEDGGMVFSTAPVLASFFLQFNVRRTGGNSAPAATNSLEVRARMVVQLWNPWTSAMVPEPLQLEVAGLPAITVEDSNGGRSVVSLGQLFGAPMKIELTSIDAAFPGDPDDQSWLPGRVYAWRSKGGTTSGWQTEFYNRTLSVPNASVWTAAAGVAYAAPANNSVLLSVSGPTADLELTLENAQGVKLWTVRAPPFAAFSTTPQRVNTNDEYRFGFPIRIVDPIDFAATVQDGSWLTNVAVDPRATLTTEPLYRLGSGGDLPSAYVGVGGNSVLTDPNRLLDRVMGRTGMSYNEDVPVFELPRAPPLSLGQLEHLQINGQRPFAFGNSWGAAGQVEGAPLLRVFDRYFFSGLDGLTASGSDDAIRLPNPNLRPATPQVRISDLLGAPNGWTSKHLLQHGAFNINSVSRAAWIGVLRSGRISQEKAPRYLNATVTTGTAADDVTSPLPTASAAFYRFPQSAQETFRADAGYAASDTAPPDAPGTSSLANTHLYRQGVRGLSQAQVAALAEIIVRNIQDHHARHGPFRSLAEFLGPDAQLEGRSILEDAIRQGGLNAAIPEFSSQWLTQGDVLALLAPVLFARSDTFMIRSYGEALNPANSQVEARIWCEAKVQRVPEYLDAASDAASVSPSALTSSLNRQFGRRFKIVSFRWLTRADI